MKNDIIYLGQQYPLTDIQEARSTKDRILLESTIMFAQKGYTTISIRDIAERCNIKPASIYNHFKNKEALWNAVLEHTKKLYFIYFERLEKSIEDSSSFEEVLGCMFIELKNVVTIFNYYGISLIQVEQFRDENAYDIFSNVFLKYSIEFIKDKFDDCIKKGWAKEFDTQVIATLFMHSVLISTSIRINTHMERESLCDVDQWYCSLERFILKLGSL